MILATDDPENPTMEVNVGDKIRIKHTGDGENYIYDIVITGISGERSLMVNATAIKDGFITRNVSIEMSHWIVMTRYIPTI